MEKTNFTVQLTAQIPVLTLRGEMALDYAESIAQLLANLVALLLCLFHYISGKRKGWAYAILFFLSALLSCYYWTAYQVIMGDSPQVSDLMAYFGWNGSYILFAIFVMMMTEMRLALWMVFLLAAAGILIWLFQSRLVAANRRIREINSTITGSFNEGITGARTIKLLSIEEKMQREFEDVTEDFRRESVRAVRYSAMLISTVTLMSSAALAVVLWQGGALTRAGLLKIGTLSVFVSYAVGMVEPLQFILYQHPGQHRAPDESPRGTRGRRGYAGSDRALRRQF